MITTEAQRHGEKPLFSHLGASVPLWFGKTLRLDRLSAAGACGGCIRFEELCNARLLGILIRDAQVDALEDLGEDAGPAGKLG